MISKTMPHFTNDTLMFDFSDSDMEDFIRLTQQQGYWITFIDIDNLEDD